MRWIVDVDLRAPSQAAIRFARSLALAGEAPEASRFIPVHVLDQDHLRSVLRVQHLDEVVDEAREGARRMLAPTTPAGSFEDVEVVQALYEEEGLAATRQAHGADGVILGRRDGRLVRLGRAARRLLRAPPCPVVVVPSRLADGALDGPILALTDLRETSASAYRFAARLARQSGRELVAVHVVPGEGPEPEESGLAAWAKASGLPADRHVVVRGDVVAQALATANAIGASAIVTGSRPRSGIERVLGRSAARAIAARASVPVVVVPSGESQRAPVTEPSTQRVPAHA